MHEFCFHRNKEPKKQTIASVNQEMNQQSFTTEKSSLYHNLLNFINNNQNNLPRDNPQNDNFFNFQQCFIGESTNNEKLLHEFPSYKSIFDLDNGIYSIPNKNKMDYSFTGSLSNLILKQIINYKEDVTETDTIYNNDEFSWLSKAFEYKNYDNDDDIKIKSGIIFTEFTKNQKEISFEAYKKNKTISPPNYNNKSKKIAKNCLKCKKNLGKSKQRNRKNKLHGSRPLSKTPVQNLKDRITNNFQGFINIKLFNNYKIIIDNKKNYIKPSQVIQNHNKKYNEVKENKKLVFPEFKMKTRSSSGDNIKKTNKFYFTNKKQDILNDNTNLCLARNSTSYNKKISLNKSAKNTKIKNKTNITSTVYRNKTKTSLVKTNLKNKYNITSKELSKKNLHDKSILNNLKESFTKQNNVQLGKRTILGKLTKNISDLKSKYKSDKKFNQEKFCTRKKKYNENKNKRQENRNTKFSYKTVSLKINLNDFNNKKDGINEHGFNFDNFNSNDENKINDLSKANYHPSHFFTGNYSE